MTTFIGSVGCSPFLIASSFIPNTNLVGGIILHTLSLMFLAPLQTGYFTAVIDHAPQYAGVTFSLIHRGNVLWNCPGILGGQTVDWISGLLVALNIPLLQLR
ncbi:hypothetical protein RF11_13796 [Thelohanellus kitauei]|uniref:Uncharacterized protein n=1 Tax=Thelohanellus kitauei TaxID=669202 RepID=A0A0C2N5U8_THEKT|nr:hypothetical protein RF11_13796 [Thelohanellus kitauei]